MTQPTIVKESLASLQGRYLNVREYSNGEVEFYSLHYTSKTYEHIALSHYIPAEDIRYSQDEGWTYQGREIPYKD